MKRYLIGIGIACMSFMLAAGCAQKKAAPKDISGLLAEKGLELTQKMDQMAESEPYRTAMSVSGELNQALTEMGEEDYSQPKNIFQITFPEGVIFSVMPEMDEKQFSDDLKAVLNQKFISALPSQVNARDGVTTLAAVSCVLTGESFVCEGLDENTLYLFLYDSSYYSMVSFVPGEDGAVYASASFLKGDSLKGIQTAEEVSTWIAETIYVNGADVEEVPLP